MVLQKFFPALVGAALLMAGAASMAAEYRADEFLGLDLSKAVLSPKPLGPATEFAPVPVEAKGDARRDVTNSDHAPDAADARRAQGCAASRHGGPASPCRKIAGRGTHQACAPAWQSARCPGLRYAHSDLAVQVGRHLQLEAVSGACVDRRPSMGCAEFDASDSRLSLI
jgi:hypothetical protein